MTIQFSQFNGYSEKEYQLNPTYPPVVTPTPTPWVRPSDWGTMPTIGASDQKFAFLASVWNDPNNWYNFSVTTSTGNYQVDWGDGTSPVTYASGATATYTYDYATTPGSPTTRGYKTCVVVVTAVTGNLTGLNMNIAAATGTTGAKRWLDIVMGSPNLTSLTYLGTGTQNSIFAYLERVKIVSFNLTNISGLFANLTYLKNIELPSLSLVTAAANMFQFCGIEILPDLDLPNCTNTSNMFNGALWLQQLGNITVSTTSNVNGDNMFSNCVSLPIVPNLAGRFSTTTSMFLNDFVLRSVPLFDTRFSNNFNSFMTNCRTIPIVPPYDTSNVTNMNLAFYNCVNLKAIPTLDYTKVTNANSTFAFCKQISNVDINLPAATTIGFTFGECSNITTANIYTTGNLTSANSTFSNCFALNYANISNVANVSNTSFMYGSTVSLIAINSQNFANASNLRGMFSGSAVNSIPSTNFPAASNVELLFANVSGQPDLSNVNVGNASNLAFMFANIGYTKTVGVTTTANTVNMRAIGQGSRIEKFTLNNPNANVFSNCGFIMTDNAYLQEFNTTNRIRLDGDGAVAFRSNQRLRQLGPFEVTANGLDASINCRSVSIANLDPINGNCLLATGLVKSSLETLMGNLGSGNTTLRGITITGNPGVDTVVTKSSNTTSGSNVVVIANTVNLSTGMLVTGNNISNGRAVTFQDTGDTVTLTAHGLNNNTQVSFSTITTTTGINVYTRYYVVNTATDTFQVSTTEGGGALALTNNGNGTLLYGTFIDTINANANIIISTPASGTATGQTLTFSVLNTSIATLKNWAVTR